MYVGCSQTIVANFHLRNRPVRTYRNERFMSSFLLFTVVKNAIPNGVFFVIVTTCLSKIQPQSKMHRPIFLWTSVQRVRERLREFRAVGTETETQWRRPTVRYLKRVNGKKKIEEKPCSKLFPVFFGHFRVCTPRIPDWPIEFPRENHEIWERRERLCPWLAFDEIVRAEFSKKTISPCRHKNVFV